MKTKYSLKGFTLAELLVVLVILGILILIALPKLMPLISEAKSLEAQKGLEAIHMFEKTYFMKHSKYSSDFKEIRFEENKTTAEGGNANYKFEILQASSNSFKAKATAISDFDGDGTINVWVIDEEKNLKEETPD